MSVDHSKESSVLCVIGPLAWIFILLAMIIGERAFAQDDPTTAAANVPSDAFFDTMVPAVEGAREVIVDVPNTFFWARYQVGEIQEWRYTLFPDGSGTVSRGFGQAREQQTLTCTQGVACLITRDDGTSYRVVATGDPAPDLPSDITGDTLSRYLAQWVLAGTGAPPPQAVVVDDAVPSPVSVLAEQSLQVTNSPTDTPDSDAPPFLNEPSVVEGTAEVIAPVDVLQPITAPPDEGRILDLSVPDETVLAAQPIPAIATIFPVSTVVVPKAPANDTGVQQPTFLGRANLRCSVTASTSLGYDDGAGGDGVGKLRANLGCSANITDQLTARFALVGYAVADEQEDFDPDFTYAFNYRVSERISLGYSNYSGRFDGDGLLDAVGSGDLRVSFVLPKLTLPNARDISCIASIGLPNPVDASTNLSCGYSVTDKFRIGATARLYFPGEQDEFDSDYSYTASYRISDDWQLSYNNYSNNRFPWNRGNSPGPGLSGGSLSLTYRFEF